MSDIKITFGIAIRKIRRSRALSQERLAEACGLHRTYISDIERGARNVSLENIEKISRGLKVRIVDLFEKK